MGRNRECASTGFLNMAERYFSKKCGHCGQAAVELSRVPYSTVIEHDGRSHAVTITDLDVPKCANCGTIVFDEEANRRITAALRKEAGLLSPEQIRQGREVLDLTQSGLAELLGVP